MSQGRKCICLFVYKKNSTGYFWGCASIAVSLVTYRNHEWKNSREEPLLDSEWEADLQKAVGITAGPVCAALENELVQKRRSYYFGWHCWQSAFKYVSFQSNKRPPTEVERGSKHLWPTITKWFNSSVTSWKSGQLISNTEKVQNGTVTIITKSMWQTQ